jgi:hypothetical protein
MLCGASLSFAIVRVYCGASYRLPQVSRVPLRHLCSAVQRVSERERTAKFETKLPVSFPAGNETV